MLDTLTTHCFNISRVGVILEALAHFSSIATIQKQNCQISQIGFWFLAFLTNICLVGMVRRFGRYSWEGGWLI